MSGLINSVKKMTYINKTDDRGNFINVPLNNGEKRIYLIENHQLNTIRAFHEHKDENLILHCLRGIWKVVHYNLGEDKPITTIMKKGDYLRVISPAGNGLMNLSEDNLMMVIADLSLSEVVEEEVKAPWDKFGEEIWLAKRR